MRSDRRMEAGIGPRTMGNVIDQMHHMAADRLSDDFARAQELMTERHNEYLALVAQQIAQRALRQAQEVINLNPPIQLATADTEAEIAA